MDMKKSHLLINESPLQVLPTLACKIGLDEAIALQQIHYWLSNQKNDGRVEDGYKWVFNTYAEWKKDNFPFWSEDKIQRVFLSLEKMGLVISAQLDAKKRDMRKFYRVDYDALCAMDDSFLRPSNTANVSHVKDELTETTTENSRPKSKLPAGSDPAFMMAAGMTSSDIAAANEQANSEKELLDLYESEMGYGVLDWYGKDLERLRKFIVKQTAQAIRDFAAWSKRPYSTFDPPKARLKPDLVPDMWPQAVKQEREQPQEENNGYL